MLYMPVSILDIDFHPAPAHLITADLSMESVFPGSSSFKILDIERCSEIVGVTSVRAICLQLSIQGFL